MPNSPILLRPTWVILGTKYKKDWLPLDSLEALDQRFTVAEKLEEVTAFLKDYAYGFFVRIQREWVENTWDKRSRKFQKSAVLTVAYFEPSNREWVKLVSYPEWLYTAEKRELFKEWIVDIAEICTAGARMGGRIS